MDGITPTFVLQVVIAIGSGGAVYGAIRADLRNMRWQIEEERRLRESLVKEIDKSIHDVRTDIGIVSNRVAMIEGKLERP